MCTLIMRLAVAAAIVVVATHTALAGLTVSLMVNGEHVDLYPILPGSGTPDDNGYNENGFVAVAGVGVNVDDDRRFDLFIDALTLSSEKTSSD